MAYHLVKNVDWDSGPGSQIKYTFHLDVDVDVVSVVGATATISVNGTYGVTNYAHNTANSIKASDFALIAPGNADAWDYQFTPGVEYYESALPCVPNAPPDVRDAVLVEFRGDTWRSDPSYPGNRSTLYQKGSGEALSNFYGQGETRAFGINTTFTLPVSQGDFPILAFVSSGWSAGPLYEWQDHEVLVSYFDLEYIPGKVWNGSTWLSHNRATNGHAKLYTPSGWSGDMKTTAGGSGTGNPPLIKHSDAYRNMRRNGQE